jgi:hypothetical protein
MGQYGNQPDFGTKVGGPGIGGNPMDDLQPGSSFQPAALYIGIGGTLVCRVVGGNEKYGIDGNPDSGYSVFINIPNGTFLPIIVDKIWGSVNPDNDSPTTCDNILAIY